jgi:diguanylate cyclase (GGDEF)-like protein
MHASMSSRSRRALDFFAVLALSVVVALVGAVDFATGAELAFSIFYLFPVGVAAWYLGWKAGTIISIESALVWYLADTLAISQPYSQSFVPAWNAGVRLTTFLVVTVLVARLRESLDREFRYARIDPLTGAGNSRAFYEETEVLIALLRRYGRPFCLLYVDVDNLKQLNDRKGHATGDEALKATVAAVRQTLRAGDTISRLGGDEFAVLISDADEGGLQVVASRVAASLHQSVGQQYQVTCSIGALACSSTPCSIDALLRRADDLMYEAKGSGKDAIRVASGDIVA